MTAVQLTTILKSLVHPTHRNFTLQFSRVRTRRRMGTYFFRRKQIVIYEPRCGTDMRIIGAGLHEIAHHVVEETYGTMLRARRRLMGVQYDRGGRPRRGRYPYHGSLYVSRLDQIVRNFNLANEIKLQGTFHYEKRKPRVPPHFVKFPTPRE